MTGAALHWPEAELLEGSEIRVLIWAGMLLCTDRQVSDSGQTVEPNALVLFLDKGQVVCLTRRFGVCLGGWGVTALTWFSESHTGVSQYRLFPDWRLYVYMLCFFVIMQRTELLNVTCASEITVGCHFFLYTF